MILICMPKYINKMQTLELHSETKTQSMQRLSYVAQTKRTCRVITVVHLFVCTYPCAPGSHVSENPLVDRTSLYERRKCATTEILHHQAQIDHATYSSEFILQVADGRRYSHPSRTRGYDGQAGISIFTLAIESSKPSVPNSFQHLAVSHARCRKANINNVPGVAKKNYARHFCDNRVI